MNLIYSFDSSGSSELSGIGLGISSVPKKSKRKENNTLLSGRRGGLLGGGGEAKSIRLQVGTRSILDKIAIISTQNQRMCRDADTANATKFNGPGRTKTLAYAHIEVRSHIGRR